LVDLDKKSAILSINPDASNTGAIIFSSLKWFLTFIIILDGGLPMHSSLIGEGKRGTLFCGASGSGKSTISSLVSTMAHSVERGSDELNAIFLSSDKFMAYSTPVSSSGGKSQLTNAIQLNNIFFLEHALYHRIEFLTRQQRFDYILKNIYHIPGNTLLCERMLDTATRFSGSPLFKRLFFYNDGTIAPFITIQNKENYETTTQSVSLDSKNR
jgi:hypothetical protein